MIAGEERVKGKNVCKRTGRSTTALTYRRLDVLTAGS